MIGISYRFFLKATILATSLFAISCTVLNRSKIEPTPEILENELATIYKDMMAFENQPLPLDHMAVVIAKSEHIDSKSREFWHLYADLQRTAGKTEAEKILVDLVRKNGLSWILASPAGRKQISDAFLDSLIADTPEKSVYFTYKSGEQTRIEEIHRFRNRPGDALPWDE
jgi:hypothetical protein